MCKIGIVCKLFMAETESIDVDIFVKLFFRNKKNQVLLFVRQEPKLNGMWKKRVEKTNLTQTNVERGARVSEKKES